MEKTELPAGNTHYVDNKRFQALLIERKSIVVETGARPRITEELGGMLLRISENLSYRRNFINYSYREEMVGDGVENCLKYIDNYDTENYANPFAYFTQACFYAFVRRINKENKQTTVKTAVYGKQVTDHQLTDNYDFQHAVNDDYNQEK